MKLHKLSALSVALVSCAYLTQCTPHQALHNVHADADLPNTSTFKYPETRTYAGSEDRFLSGEFGLSANTAASSNRFHDPAVHQVDDGVDKHTSGIYVDKYRWLEEYDPINPNLGKETDADRERNLIGTLAEDDRGLVAEATKFLKTVPPKTSSEVNDWVNAQNAFTQDYIQNLPIYQNLKANQRSLKYAYHEHSITKKKDVGEFRYYRDTDGWNKVELTRNDGTVVELINEQKLTPENSLKTYVMGGLRISPTGEYIAFRVRDGRADADAYYIRVISTKTGEYVTPEIYTVTANYDPPTYRWFDDHTLYYTSRDFNISARDVRKNRFNDPIIMDATDVENGGSAGTFSFKGEKNRYIISESYYYRPNIHIKDLQTGKSYRLGSYKFVKQIRAKGTSFNNDVVAKLVHFDPKTRDAYIISGENDARGQIIKLNLDNLSKREVVLEFNDNFDLMRSAILHEEGDGYFVVNWLKDGVNRLTLINAKTGEIIKELTPPEGSGAISELASNVVGKEEDSTEDKEESDDPEANENYVFFRFENPTFPQTDYKYSISKDKFLDIRRFDLTPFDHNAYETKLVKYKSYDGTEIPMNISYKKGIKLDGNNPTILYGYGGYGVIYDQMFGFPAMAEWLENGGVWAHAFIRGGGEYGDQRQRAAQHINRTIGYDDFAAATDYLHEKGYARPEKMGIIGASNGGQLVGAELVRHPGKYAVALPGVGVFDMFRHEKMGVTQYWMGEAGTPEEGNVVAEVMRSYSPQHNLHKGVCYPATLIWASKRDDRVVPSHSYKFGAALQEAQSCNRPVLLRNAEDAGHSPNTYAERQDVNLDIVAFAFNEMGVKHTDIINRPTREEMKTDKWRAEDAKKAQKKAEEQTKKD